MWFIISKEIKRNLKNPIVFLGAVLMLVGIYSSCNDYLNFPNVAQDNEFEELHISEMSCADIHVGYIPTTDAEIRELSIEMLFEGLKSAGVTDEEISKTKERIGGLSLEETLNFLKKKFSFYTNMDAVFSFVFARLGTPEEIMNYIDASLEEENYTTYVARKVSDFLSIYGFYYILLVLAISFYNEFKKDIYELLHTKPIRSTAFILGKGLGGFLSISITMLVIVTIINIYAIIQGIELNMPVNFFDMYFYTFVLNLPFVFYICFCFIFISLVFKTIFPAIPLLLVHIAYSNMLGNTTVITGDLVSYTNYEPKFLAALCRFPGRFFETILYPSHYINLVLLMVITIIMIITSIKIWERRRLQ